MPVYIWITLITIPGLWELIVILSTPCELVVLLKFYLSDHSQYLVVSHSKRDTNAATLKEAGQDMSEGLPCPLKNLYIIWPFKEKSEECSLSI